MTSREQSDRRETRGGPDSGHAQLDLASPFTGSRDDVDPAARRLGRYQLIEKLGRGGMGTIYLGLAGGLGKFRKLVVLKVLREELTGDPKFVEMFMREAALAASLNHPNVVQTIEAQEDNGRYFLVMEFLDGQPFSRLLRTANQAPGMSLGLRLRVLCGTLAGLHYAHELTDYDGQPLHMVHCDVSPPNLFVTYDGQVKLLDFGIARARDVTACAPGEFTGKLGYAAPEHLRGDLPDRRIDVFGAGIVLWEAIALRHIAQGKAPPHIISARLSGTEPRISQVVPEVDGALAAICDRALHGDPAFRYQSAEEMRLDLEAYLAARDPSADPTALSAFMRVKFAGERASMHRLIDSHMRWGPGGTTENMTGMRHGGELTGASSLSRTHDRASLELGLPTRRPARDQTLRMVGMAGAVLILALVFWLARRDGEPTATPMATSPSALPTVTTEPATSAPVTSTPLPGAVAPTGSVAVPREITSNGASQAAAPREPGGSAAPRVEALPAQEGSPQPSAEQRATSASDAAAVDASAGAARGHGRRSRDERGHGAHPESDEGEIDERRPAAKTSEPEPFDLRRVPRREQRRLDTDNPFR